MNYISNSNNDLFVENTNNDMLKHVESLRTRLGFARFKLNNGWENNTLVDVECFWKQKQKQSMRNIPIPRFTQQDIIDKRSYIQASGAKHAKARRYRLLNRSLSASSTQDNKRDFISSTTTPSLSSAPSSFINTTNTKLITKKARRKSHPISSTQQRYNSSGSSSSSSNSSICSNDDEDNTTTIQQQQQQQQPQKYHFHHYDNHKSTPTPIGNHSVSSFDASCVPNDLNGEPSIVKNSLDYLSYAIAMTENNNTQQTTNVDEKEDWTRTSQLRLSLSIPNHNNQPQSDIPPSPSTNVAAQAMLMFVNRESSSSSS
ncbi:unnamed protein product [Mucor hiemalis]